MNIHQRTAQLKAVAKRIVANSPRTEIPNVKPNAYGLFSEEIEQMVNETGCTRDTARRHIGRAFRKKIGY